MNRGARFSMNARGPSFAYSDAKTTAAHSASMRIASARAVASLTPALGLQLAMGPRIIGPAFGVREGRARCDG